MTELFNKKNGTENATKYDLDQFIYTKTHKRNRKTPKPPAFSIVNNSSKVIKMCREEILQLLNYPEDIQIAYINDLLILTNSFNQNAPKYEVETAGKRGIINSKPLVLELIDDFNLDRFGQTTLTFDIYDYTFENNQTYIFINMMDPILK